MPNCPLAVGYETVATIIRRRIPHVETHPITFKTTEIEERVRAETFGEHMPLFTKVVNNPTGFLILRRVASIL